MSAAYPSGWLGVLADVSPCRPEVVYASHLRGFAPASMRSPTRSSFHVHVALDEKIMDWSDDRNWKTGRSGWYLTRLMHRFPEDGAFERRMRDAEQDYIARSELTQAQVAENDVGLRL